VSRQADFYGAMDGSSKFVKGDAIAGLLITAINIVGGIFIGAFQRGLPISQALSQYTILTVGDGLVTQIPALIISTAAGIMVTHAAGGSRMGVTLANQLSAHPRSMIIAGTVLGGFGLVPGLPKLPFMLLGGGMVMLGRATATAERKRAVIAAAEAQAAQPAAPTADPMTDLLQIDPIELEVGYALIPLVDEKQGGDLLERISMLRKQSAQELGILVPAIRIRDDIRLPANEYIIKLRGAEIARGEVMPRFLLALDTGRVMAAVEGIDTLDPSFGMPAKWIATTKRVEAESLGYVVVEPATVVATHLMEKLKSSASDLLGRQDVQEMIDALKKSHPALVDDVVPNKLTLGVLHRVLQRLLRERVPIRDLVTILEAVADAADQTKDPEVLTEHARRALTNTIARLYMDETGTVRGITVGPKLELSLLGLFSPRANANPTALLTPDSLGGLLRELDQMSSSNMVEGRPLPLLAPPSLRVGVRRLVEPVLPNLPVVSLAELPPYVKLSAVATWEIA
jgi:flagellar biosynthesis protein FlhA